MYSKNSTKNILIIGRNTLSGCSSILAWYSLVRDAHDLQDAAPPPQRKIVILVAACGATSRVSMTLCFDNQLATPADLRRYRLSCGYDGCYLAFRANGPATNHQRTGLAARSTLWGGSGSDDDSGIVLVRTGHSRDQPGAGDGIDGLRCLALAGLDQQVTARCQP
jgi:hypothetical protein